jgi:aspartate/methionine/tyrosine aminotransferase
MKAIGSETYSAVSAPIQYAAITAYDNLPEIDEFMQRSTEIHELIGNYVYRRLKKANYEVAKPEGAFYLLPSVNHKLDNILDKGIYTSKDLVEHMIINYGVAAIAGTAFGLNSEDLSFRLAYIDYDGREVMKEYCKDIDAAKSDPELFIRKYAPRIETGTDRLHEMANDLFE